MKRIVLSLSVLLFMSIPSEAAQKHTHKHLCNFVPKNNLKISIKSQAFTSGGIDESSFNAIIDQVETIYSPIITALGGKLKMNRLWSNDTVNASATRDANYWIVSMYGGLARHPYMTNDGFALVLCHELGHQIGGYPKVITSVDNRKWASNEGQADYFSVMKCFRKLSDSSNFLTPLKVSAPKSVEDSCSNTFKSTSEINLCKREVIAGQALAKTLTEIHNAQLLFSNMTKGTKYPLVSEPNIDTPSKEIVIATYDGHSDAQCRLDTFLAGSICGVSYTDAFGNSDPSTGACASEKGDRTGFRPTCWYKPH